MGVLNVTPDSFSDGGRFEGDVGAAVEHGLTMAKQGAAIIDVGGESTRPGASSVSEDEQLRRVLPVVEGLRRSLDIANLGDVLISVDTTLPGVARAALDAGARMLNDISAGRARDAVSSHADAMLDLAAARNVPIVLMHMLGSPATMQQAPAYHDVVMEVRQFLLERAAAAMDRGLPRDHVVLDPGIGFGKTLEHNIALLARLDTLVVTGHPVLLGASRKRFIAGISQASTGISPSPDDRLGGTCAATALGVRAGVRIIRVHDLPANRQAMDLAAAVRLRSPF
ncbi:MAG: dihydropteroate synthase [Phycisphaeraceae bacterium]|nr:dihydropteroate synthase [Phycisphaeraceae bacterium]